MPSLTDFALRNAKPKDKPYKLFDGGGLHLHVNPNGSRIWRLAYRFGGKPKQFSFGPYPATSLADAREKLKEAKQQRASGRDPTTLRKRDKVTAAVNASNTFALLADEYQGKSAREAGPGPGVTNAGHWWEPNGTFGGRWVAMPRALVSATMESRASPPISS